jgi:hypothetical protein
MGVDGVVMLRYVHGYFGVWLWLYAHLNAALHSTLQVLQHSSTISLLIFVPCVLGCGSRFHT